MDNSQSLFGFTDTLIRRHPIGLTVDLSPVASLPPLTAIGNGLSLSDNALQLVKTGVQAGVYNRVQVDVYGRVVAGIENSSLSPQTLTTDSVIDGGTF